VYSNDRKMLGTYEIEVDVWLKWYPGLKSKYTFSVEIALCQPKVLVPSFEARAITLKVGDGSYEQALPTFSSKPKCGYDIAYELKNLPAFVDYNEGKLTVKAGYKESEVGSYSVDLVATCTAAPLKVEATVNFPINILTAIKKVE